MPQGEGTYGSTVGRPPKKDKSRAALAGAAVLAAGAYGGRRAWKRLPQQTRNSIKKNPLKARGRIRKAESTIRARGQREVRTARGFRDLDHRRAPEALRPFIDKAYQKRLDAIVGRPRYKAVGVRNQLDLPNKR